MWELCDIVLVSAGFCSAGPPGTRELARINEDAKVAPRLPPLMVRWYTNVEADNTICHMAPLPQELLLCNLATEKTRVYICVNIRALASQAHLDHIFFRGMRVIDEGYRSLPTKALGLPCHRHSISLSHARIHNGPITANGNTTPYLTITSVWAWER